MASIGNIGKKLGFGNVSNALTSLAVDIATTFLGTSAMGWDSITVMFGDFQVVGITSAQYSESFQIKPVYGLHQHPEDYAVGAGSGRLLLTVKKATAMHLRRQLTHALFPVSIEMTQNAFNVPSYRAEIIFKGCKITRIGESVSRESGEALSEFEITPFGETEVKETGLLDPTSILNTI